MNSMFPHFKLNAVFVKRKRGGKVQSIVVFSSYFYIPEVHPTHNALVDVAETKSADSED